MAEVKSARADAFIERPDPQFRTFLFYGPDAGLVGERADALAARLGVDPNDPFALVRVDADVAAADPPRLAEEANTIAMFGGARLIRVSGTTRRNLAEAVRPLLDAPPQDGWVIIEAGDLKREAALRRQIERSASGVAIACYPDDEAALSRLIAAELSTAGLAIDDDAGLLLRSLLGGDRRASRNELAKLALYCQDRRRVTVDDVRNVIGDSSLLAVDDAVDAAMAGDVPTLHKLLGRLDAAGLAPDMIILAALRHFQLLHQARHRVDAHREPPAGVASGLRPPLHFKRRDSFIAALRHWRADALARALARLDRAAFEARANPALARSLAATALIALALQAARGRSG
ncbi:MAG: DNA polymerase III subunit delta [Alphaproteobacteria bacterium]|nr:MAG: DNA polymerase III subunit delta [Alphaproteobacteria bacterium]